MRFDIKLEKATDNTMAVFRVEGFMGTRRVTAFYAQGIDVTKGHLSTLQQIAAKAPNCCNDFSVTHARWDKEGKPYDRRLSEWKAYCPHHIGIGFPAYQIAYEGGERVFECTYCGCTFPESRGQECDER